MKPASVFRVLMSLSQRRLCDQHGCQWGEWELDGQVWKRECVRCGHLHTLLGGPPDEVMERSAHRRKNVWG